MRLGFIFAAAIAGFLAFVLAATAPAQPLGPAHVKLQLAAQTQGAAPGSTLYVALIQKIDKGWHTYWRNPGDTGEPTKIVWTLPRGWRAGDIVWPTPHRIPVGPLMNYGYEDAVLLPTPLEVPASATVGETAHLKAAVSLLVCADVCVPQESVVQLDVPVVAAAPAADPTWGAKIAKNLADAPKPSGLAASFQSTAGTVTIAAAGAPLAGTDFAGAYFFPYDATAIDQAKPESIDRGAQGVTLAATPGPLFAHAAPSELSGVLALPGGAYEITAIAGPPPPGSGGLGPPARPAPGMNLAVAAVFAFLGGLILNLMPCVFPVLSMKASAFIGHADETARARTQGLAFLAGVLAAFLSLAAIIIAARGAGVAAGWGSQLQPAVVTASLTLLILAAALNLSGLYEIGTSIQGLGAGLASRAGLIGSAFTGALAVVVAAPCTAPFMGPALGYALTQPTPVALAVFTALGLGFAAPFTALSFSPALLRALPKPGPWMDVTRKLLAFPMYGTAAWLLWVLSQQTDATSLAAVLAGGVLLGFAAWLFGAAQRGAARGGRIGLVAGLATLALAAAVAMIAIAPYRPAARAGGVVSAPVFANVPAETWSAERVASLRAQGKPVFVDFTAAWCVTCQVNEQVALNTAEAAAAFRRTGAVFLKADWTNRDASIAKALAEQGRVGVPLYLVYSPGSSQPRVLPQLLTSGLVAQALEAAAAKPRALAER
ncbi:MAG: protein-disulfide reductase DsbD family protein [Caulobacterales bacterium]